MDDTTKKQQKQFLENFKIYGLESIAMDACGIDSDILNLWLECPTFKKRYDEAALLSVERIEALAMDVAKHGRRHPLYFKGEPVYQRNPVTNELLIDPETFEYIPAYETKYDESLLKFFIQGNKKKYKEGGDMLRLSDQAPTNIVINLISADGSKRELTPPTIDITPTTPPAATPLNPTDNEEDFL
jgi:hypothetical protein